MFWLNLWVEKCFPFGDKSRKNNHNVGRQLEKLNRDIKTKKVKIIRTKYRKS